MKTGIMAAIAVLSVFLGIGVGSVFISPVEIVHIFAYKLFDAPLPADFNQIYAGLLMDIRLPRVFLAFLVGAALAVSGAVMQSVLKNPLASSYGLGVSSGAGLGAAIIMVAGLSSGLLGTFLLPAAGLLFGLVTVFAAIAIATRIDRTLSNNTIILTGMVLSLFMNAIMSTIAATSSDHAQRIALWQLGSFSMKEWRYVWTLLPFVIFCTLFFIRYSRELDLMTFGEEQAAAMGIEIKKAKGLLIAMTAVLTGTAISFAGVIGFVDLIAPHVIRRFYGSGHRQLIPMCALFGGSFMVICDLLARTLISPSEIPIGSITALVGAPFFTYIYFASRKR